MKTAWLSMALIFLAAGLTSCGGGGAGSNGGSNGGGNGGGPAALTITTSPLLPTALQAHAYSTTLAAANGQGQLHWTIARIAPTVLFVDGLSIDPNTGVLSGTANFAGTGGFIATVTDSASPARSVSADFTISAYSLLSSAGTQTITLSQYSGPFPSVRTGIQGGFPPVVYSVTSGTIPPGLRFDSTGQLTGAAVTMGSYQFTLTAQDSFSPPEIATQPFTITVTPPPLLLGSSLPPRLAINQAFSGKVVAVGGVPPYRFAVTNPALPPGLSLDANTGILSGTPTKAADQVFFFIQATDSTSPTPQQATTAVFLAIGHLFGRNDTPATATPIGNGFYLASISPYIDPPNGPPLAADNDYYRLVSLGGATVHVETFAKRNSGSNPLDTVIEIVDGNGVRLNTCRQPGDTSTVFSGPCINDDISASPHIQDSALDFRVPGAGNIPTTFSVHVFDWRGDARPDMVYNLQVSGVIDPLIISTTPLAATRGLSYSWQLGSSGGVQPLSWSISSGSLPPGLTLSPTGTIAGTATGDGTYPFTVVVSDALTPPQTASAQEQIQVVEPVKITSSASWPDACLNQPYSFMVQTSGGVPPLYYSLFGGSWPISNVDQSNGTISGTPSLAGSFTVQVNVVDATSHGDAQQVGLTVKQCP